MCVNPGSVSPTSIHGCGHLLDDTLSEPRGTLQFNGFQAFIQQRESGSSFGLFVQQLGECVGLQEPRLFKYTIRDVPA